VTEHRFVTDLGNKLESRENEFEIQLETQNVDGFSLGAVNYFESVPEVFLLPGDVPVSAGNYSWTNFDGEIETSNVRPLAFEIEFECCRFYDGNGFELAAELSYRPNQYFEIAAGYEGTFLDLPAGAVDIHLLTLDSVVNFTPDMQFALQVQYDNISESFGLLGRYRWEFRPGSELFVALGQSALIPDRRFLAQTTLFSIRLGHTIQL
jgi:hypothetical protein